MRRAVSTASRCVDGRGSWGDRLDARRGRRRRRGGGAEAARSGEREENARSVFACVDVGNVGEHAFHSRELERACAVVRTRCFYEIENERRGETLTFSFDDADEADEAAGAAEADGELLDGVGDEALFDEDEELPDE